MSAAEATQIETIRTNSEITDKSRSDVAETERDIELHLEEDIYNFYLLLREKEQYKQLPVIAKYKLKFLFFVCLFVQFGGAVVLILQDDAISYDLTEHVSIDCAETAIEYTNCVIGESRYDYIYTNKMGFVGYFVRFVSIALIDLYIYPTLVSIPIYAVQIKHLLGKNLTKTKKIYTISMWVFISILQMSLFAIVIAKVAEIVYKSTSDLDVLSSGIGFIILLEVDSFIFVSFYRNVDRYYQVIMNEKLFTVKLTGKDRQHTIWRWFSVDGLQLFAMLFGLIFTIWGIIIPCSWYSWGFDRYNKGKYDDVLFYGLASYTPVVVLGVFMLAPFVYALFSSCTCCRSR